MDKDKVIHRLVPMVAYATGRRAAKINAATKINGNWGIDGQDAVDLLFAVRDGFGIDIGDFEYDRFFGPELPFNPVLWIILKLSGRLKPSEPITVDMLAEYVAARLTNQSA